MRELDLQISAWVNLRDVIVSGEKKKKKRVAKGYMQDETWTWFLKA